MSAFSRLYSPVANETFDRLLHAVFFGPEWVNEFEVIGVDMGRLGGDESVRVFTEMVGGHVVFRRIERVTPRPIGGEDGATADGRQRDASRGRFLCEVCFDASTDQILPAGQSPTGLEMAWCGCEGD